METIFNRWDQFDANGPWNQYVMRDLVDGANQEDAWKKEFGGRIKDLGQPEGLSRTVDNPLFKDQDTGELMTFTRKNLLSVMLNTGTGTGKKSNLLKLAEGYNLEPDQVMAWVHTHATPEDWKVGPRHVGYLRGYQNPRGHDVSVAVGRVARRTSWFMTRVTPFGVVKGGYYPIIYHGEMEGKSKS